MPELIKLGIPKLVGKEYESFGVTLLQDKHGDDVANIKHNCGMDVEAINRNILRKWLRGEGMSVTWENLALALRSCMLITFANQIEKAYGLN